MSPNTTPPPVGTNTPPPVGTIMKSRDMRAEVLLSSAEYAVVRDVRGWLRAVERAGDKWRDSVNNIWEIEEPEPPTLAVGTVLYRDGYLDQTVVSAAPGFVLVQTRYGRRSTMAWIDNGWRHTSEDFAWEVRR
jgi:hypothetical protein